MARCRHRDRGETLVEIILAVVIIGISVSALVSGLATAANAGIVQRDSALADTLLRNMAESAKSDARSCTPGRALSVSRTAPTGWSTSVMPPSPACPAVSSPLRVTVAVTAPDGRVSSLDVVVRTP